MGTAPGVLLLSEATLLAVVALAAIVIVALVVLALVLTRPVQQAAPPQPMPQPIPLPVAAPQPVPRAATARHVMPGRTLEIDVPTKHVDDFMTALRASGWRVHETGEVVATDEDEEALTTVLVDVPQTTARAATGEEVR